MTGNGVVLLLLVVVGVCAFVVAASFGLDYFRALERRTAECVKLRSRLQTARMVVQDLIELPSSHTTTFALGWLREGDEIDDPHRLYPRPRTHEGRRW